LELKRQINQHRHQIHQLQSTSRLICLPIFQFRKRNQPLQKERKKKKIKSKTKFNHRSSANFLFQFVFVLPAGFLVTVNRADYFIIYFFHFLSPVLYGTIGNNLQHWQRCFTSSASLPVALLVSLQPGNNGNKFL